MADVYKILPAAAWADHTGHVPWAPVDHTDGFLHLSAAHQVRGTAQAHFAEEQDLLILQLDTAQVPELKWEESRHGQLFPHAYAQVPVSAVVAVHRLVGQVPGEFRFPDGC